jgi:hypothetical protein
MRMHFKFAPTTAAGSKLNPKMMKNFPFSCILDASFMERRDLFGD